MGKVLSDKQFNLSFYFNSFLKDSVDKKDSCFKKKFIQKQLLEFRQQELEESLKKGITKSQWEQIKSFQIVGDRQHRKVNFQIGINHLFNLRSMFKKINSAKKLSNKKKEKNLLNKKKKKKSKNNFFETLTQKDAQLLKSQIPENFEDSFEMTLSDQKSQKNQKNNLEIKKTNKTKTKKNELKQLKPKNSDTNTKTKKRKIKNKKRKVKKQKSIQNNVNQNLHEKFDFQDFEDFKNTREMELIKKNLEIFNQSQNLEEDESFQISRDIEKLTEYQMKKKEDQISIISDKNSGFSDFGDEMKEKLNQILMSDIEENKLDELPFLDKLEEDQIQNFKQNIKQQIFFKKIFEQKEFEKFLEKLIKKNNHIQEEMIKNIFEELKEELYEQFKEEIEETNDY